MVCKVLINRVIICISVAKSREKLTLLSDARESSFFLLVFSGFRLTNYLKFLSNVCSFSINAFLSSAVMKEAVNEFFARV